jgi:hypothetical protein
MENIIPFTEFNPANIKLSKLRTLDNGGKIVYLTHNGKPPVIQTPEMQLPYGLSKWDNDGKQAPKYSLDMSFKGMESRELLKKFFDNLNDFDEFMKKEGLANAEEWFKNKKATKDFVSGIYTHLVRRSADDKYPPTFKMTVPYDHEAKQFRCKVFDKVTKEPLDLSEINLKGGKATAIVQCTGVWIAGKGFGTTWKLIQLRVEQSAKITEYAFRDIEGDQADDVESDSDEELDTNPTPINTVVQPPADDDDELTESDEEDELDKKPAKKVTTRGKK